MNLPVEVIEAVGRGACVLFAGGRFSAEGALEAGRPWTDDAALARELGWERPKRMVGSAVKARGPVVPSVSEGARIFAEKHGEGALRERLRALLELPGVAPTAAHRAAVRRFPSIFTTNLDDLLERAAAALGPLALAHRGDPLPEGRFVYKLRGDFATGPCVSPAHRAARPLCAEVERGIRQIIRRNVVFFVGYKPDEEEFEILWHELTRCFGGELPRCHMAVAQGRIDDYLWQKWVWRGLLLFTADPGECMAELEARLGGGDG